MATWINLEDTCRMLGVRPQTVYAYVSRGRLQVAPDPSDLRRSVYRAEDVQALARRKRAGRSHETVATNTLFGQEPSIPTAVCSFHRGRPCYRGVDAIGLAAEASLEDAARLLWDAAAPVDFADRGPVVPEPGRRAAFVLLAGLTATGHSTRGRRTHVLHDEAQALVGTLAGAFGAAPGQGLPLHLRLAAGWQTPAAVADLLRMAMVLLADHELTSSAFSARIAASTGASLPACLLAGLTTFSGPQHGDASGRVRALFDDVDRLGEDRVIDHHLGSGLAVPGFGHPIYPDGDPRAAALLARFDPPAHLQRFIDRVAALTGLAPNIDVALAALVARHQLPADAAFAVFATARSVGLLAHSIEQLGEAQMIRPRGRYIGPAPQPLPPTASPTPA